MCDGKIQRLYFFVSMLKIWEAPEIVAAKAGAGRGLGMWRLANLAMSNQSPILAQNAKKPRVACGHLSLSQGREIRCNRIPRAARSSSAAAR